MTTDADNDPVDAQPPAPETSAPESSAALLESDGSADAKSEPAAERRQRSGRGVIVFTLALACFAAGAAGFLWWQYRQFYVALDRADGETEIALRDVRAELRGLEDALGELGEDRAELVDVVEEIVDRVDEMPARFAALDGRMAAMQGVSSNARGRWLRAQAEYYLRVANTELTLRHSRANAVAALELADRALLDTGSPAYAAVRERIAGEVLGLEAVAVPDVEGLSFSLAQLKTSVATLPMRSPGPDGGEAVPIDDAPPGIGRLWQSVKSALAGMFRVERRDTSSALSLSRNQQTVVRRQIELELTLARAGLVEAMPELYAASIASARELLLAHFDTQDVGVEGAVALLDEMAELDVAPAYPDISGSLTLLRDITDRDG